MQDLTAIYLTLSRLPQHFADYQLRTLQEALGSYPCIVVSPSKIPWDVPHIRDDGPYGYLNIYRQMLNAAKVATTRFVAIAEDDVLYPPEHFTFYRPPLDTFAYNQNRWALFTWGEPLFSWRNRKSNCTLIAPRELLIEALEERFAKHGNDWHPDFIGELGRERVERGLGVTVRKSIEVFSNTSVIQFNHQYAHEDRQRRQRKSYGPMRAHSIPYWGDARTLIATYA